MQSISTKSGTSSKESNDDACMAVPVPVPVTRRPRINCTPKDASLKQVKGTLSPYVEPNWSDKPPVEHFYKFEVLKSGQIIEEINDLQSKAFWLFGRFPGNNMEMAHPTVSRFHAVLQYRPKKENATVSKDGSITDPDEGWYVYDTGSTHGTFINKQRIPPKTYVRIRVGYILKLGTSTRHFILQGPEFDKEPETELSVTEIKQLHEQQRKQGVNEKEGISWGMNEDADEETDLSVNPYASTCNEELFFDDPKKTLRGFFEREGLSLEYKCDELSVGSFVCRVELPIDDTNGRSIVAEACHKGKKKDCVVQCALEACRILDRNGVLRQSHHEPLKRKTQNTDSDDDDDFLDRTGDILRKKQRKEIATKNSALTYEDLLTQQTEILNKISSVDASILKYQEASKRIKDMKKRQEEDLDSFMETLNDDLAAFDKNEIRHLRVEQQQLKAEHLKIQRLIKIAQPVSIPLINPNTSTECVKKKSMLPLFGKRNKFIFSSVSKTETKSKTEEYLKSDEEEIEEDDNNVSTTPCTTSSTKEIKNSEFIKTVEATKEDRLTDKNKSNNIDDKKINATTSKILEESTISSEVTKTQPIEIETQKQKHDQEFILEQKDGSAEKYDQQSEIEKKRRNRCRIRNSRRENVDIDDNGDHEDIGKYSDWVPPDNQSGDGLTLLNQKFGY